MDLKWPNDLLWDGRKCVGILSQGRSNGQASRVVVGVGINVNRPEQVAPRIERDAVWLSEAGGEEFDRSAILATLLSIYERDFDRLLNEPAKVIADWALVANLAGRRVVSQGT